MTKYLVEFLGTMLLVFVIFATGNWLAIGAALALAVYLGGAISGGRSTLLWRFLSIAPAG